MSLYIDTSCLLKLLTVEPESARVHELVGAEELVVVSALTRLETLVRIQAWRDSGRASLAGALRLVDESQQLLQTEPLRFRACPPTIWEETESQISPALDAVDCRTLDRLHLAAARACGLGCGKQTALGTGCLFPRRPEPRAPATRRRIWRPCGGSR